MPKDLVTPAFIEESLGPLNGRYFHIDDLPAYATKVTTLGRALAVDDDLGPAAYLLFYDDGPTAFVTMTWTRADRAREGLMRGLLDRLANEVRKDVRLEVHADNPARRLYINCGFVETSPRRGNTVSMVRLQPPELPLTN